MVAKSNALFTERYTTMDAADKVVEHLYMNINLSCSEVIGKLSLSSSPPGVQPHPMMHVCILHRTRRHLALINDRHLAVACNTVVYASSLTFSL